MRPLARPVGWRILVARGAAALTTLALMGPWTAAAAADPTPTEPAVRRDPDLGPARPGQPVCTMTDPRLLGVSGMIATRTGYVVVNDQAVNAPSVQLFYLNAACAVVKVYTHNRRPRDPEDLALAPDGSVWIADIGDNNVDRATVVLWRVPADQGPAIMYRLRYPDGPHDAEALMFDGDGLPLIVIKSRENPGIYRPAAPLVADSSTGVALRKVGEFVPHDTRTSNPFWIAGEVVVTGAANAPDGSRVVLRTYSDAYEFVVTGGDVVNAIAHGTPRITPLPDEPQGESIAYSPDGTTFLTASDTTKQRTILRYVPFVPTPPTLAPTAAAMPVTDAPSMFTFADLRRVMAGGGLAGAGLLVAGIIGIRRARRRRQADGHGAPDTQTPDQDHSTDRIILTSPAEKDR